MRLSIDIKISDLIDELKLDNEFAIEFVRLLDKAIADCEFTEALRDYFVEEMMAEDAIDSECICHETVMGKSTCPVYGKPHVELTKPKADQGSANVCVDGKAKQVPGAYVSELIAPPVIKPSSPIWPDKPEPNKFCSICLRPQYRIPSGLICKEGLHGGAPSLTREQMLEKREVFYDGE